MILKVTMRRDIHISCPRSDAMSDCERIKGGETECGDSSSQEEIHTVVPDEVSEPPSTSDEVERIKCDGESFSKLSRKITEDIVACAISGMDVLLTICYMYDGNM